MSDYKRLISYVYMYQSEVKGRNVGYVKLETRNGQCKIGISLKGIPSGNTDMEVFLFAYELNISVGKIYIRNGQGETRIVTDQNNIVNTGTSLSMIGGLKIISRANPEVFYATIWDDELMDAPVLHVAAVPEEEAEIQAEEPDNITIMAEDVDIAGAAGEWLFNEARSDTYNEEWQNMTESGSISDNTPPADQPQKMVTEGDNVYQSSQDEPETTENMSMRARYTEMEEEVDSSEYPTELRDEGQQNLWKTLEKKFPKAKCVATDVPHQILTIQPQDIGLLPREAWVFGNNSFLLHGYFQYRYLILIKMNIDENKERYLLGVPGIYHNNERFMATMFGFPNFYLAKRQPSKTGQFGYWCSEIRIS